MSTPTGRSRGRLALAAGFALAGLGCPQPSPAPPPKPEPLYDGRSLGEWLRAFDRHPSAHEHLPAPEHAAEVLVTIGAPAVEGVLEIDTHLDFRYEMLQVRIITGIGAPAVPELHKAIRAGRSTVAALKALARMPQHTTDETVALVADMLTHPGRVVRAEAANALGAIGPRAAAAAGKLAAARPDEDPDVRRAVARALEAVGPAAARP